MQEPTQIAPVKAWLQQLLAEAIWGIDERTGTQRGDIRVSLNAGDSIVGSGLNRIQPGAPVRVAGQTGRSTGNRRPAAVAAPARVGAQ